MRDSSKRLPQWPPCPAVESPSDLQHEFLAPATVETMLSFWPVPNMVSHSEWGYNDGLVPVIAIDGTKIGSKTKNSS